MSAIMASITGHPLVTYFLLAFAISWGGILVLIGPGDIPGRPEQFETQLPAAVLAMLAGPSTAGLLMTALLGGRRGLREVRSRLLHWRVAARWYAVALLTAPLLLTMTIIGLSLWSPVFLPGILAPEGRWGLLVMGVGYGLGAGFFEELGWTGFAIPRMRRHSSIAATGLSLGLLWGAWHFVSTLWGSTGALGTVPLAVYLIVALFSFLPPFRVLMVWVYDRTGSLLVAMLMHASLTTSVIALGPATQGASFLAYHLAWAGALWLAVAVVVRADRERFGRRHGTPTGAAPA